MLNLVPGEPLSLVKELACFEVGVACNGVQRGAPFTNITKMCRPLGTCVALDVDLGAACTWEWIYPRCHGPVGRRVGFVQ